MEQPTATIAADESRSTLRRAATASFIGNFVEWFDYASYGYLATTIALVFFPEADRTVEGFAAAWDRIADRASDAPIQNGMEQSMHAMGLLQKASGG